MIEAVEGADAQGQPLCVVGGGSNLLATDQPFPGLVVRDARQEIYVLDEAAPVEGQERTVQVGATAGANWDDFVAYCVRMGLAGVEGLSGIPGSVGASVVQNIGAYGQDLAQVIQSVEVWDRERKVIQEFSGEQMAFGYRTSTLKASMYAAPGQAAEQFYPTPRYVVLSVTAQLRHSHTGRVDSDQLAKALGVDLGAQMPTEQIRKAVLAIRARKGMLEDPYRYQNPWMLGTRQDAHVLAALEELEGLLEPVGGLGSEQGQELVRNRHSCGSFFTNPIVSQEEAARLPQEAPRFPTTLPQGQGQQEVVKTSAAWLIDHAGFHPGFSLPGSHAALSSVHTLALTNRGGAQAQEVFDLAKTIQEGVQRTYGVTLVPEPVLVGKRSL
ncbi:UDP-N-acetylenolpyruvoylglucosamine reductase [Bombiscardovia nodaiensis]|uniref:UDP-N-acetylenolpyruvoylglucosamine reductase n=1 Tax=Bombiscardovia nodaiensis TaxID=2932181 RepID=A0ABM8B6R0_9BIFI|nr:UDP-N-acetylenolpyruvoylglucosamine reductase [Bombiscardovia nodaiensis]